MFQDYIQTQEHQIFRKGLQDFLKREVSPHINQWEKDGTIERFIWEKFGEMGYLGLYQPEEFGGLGLNLSYTTILLEELQKINSGGFAAAIWAHSYLAMTHLKHEASDYLKEKYLTPSIKGEKIGCLCITEPAGGSDVAAMKTVAKEQGDYFLLNGEKTFITNGYYSDYLIVSAKTNPEAKSSGISLFLIDRNSEGISSFKLDKLGWRASDTAQIAFDNVKVPKQNLLGNENDGFKYIMQHFALERIIMAINAHARAEYAIDYTLDYIQQREAFGKKLNNFQVIRHSIARLSSKVEIIKNFNYLTVQQIDAGNYPVKEATMAKLEACQLSDKVVYECLQMLGGYGYMEDYPLARLSRDSRLGPIGGGTDQIMCEILAKIIVDKKNYVAPKVD